MSTVGPLIRADHTVLRFRPLDETRICTQLGRQAPILAVAPRRFAMTSQVVFAEPVRTAIGTFAGSLKDVPATALGSAAIAAAVARAELRPEEIETVVMGNV